MTPTSPEPALADSSAVCGWTLGFPPGEACIKPSADTWCDGHQRVDRRIAVKARAIARSSATLLSEDMPVTSKALRAAGNPRARAEEWWLKVGVRQIPRPVREKVLHLPFKIRCTYCGGRWATEVDHIVPVTCGGLSGRENLAPACTVCNREKSDTTPQEWRARRLAESLCWPPEPWDSLVDAALTAMLREGPPAFLADLACALPPADDLPRTAVHGDPRWKRAMDALKEERDDLTEREIWLRRRAAILVGRWVGFDREPPCEACGISLDMHGVLCGIEVSARDGRPAEWVLAFGVVQGTRIQMPVLIEPSRSAP